MKKDEAKKIVKKPVTEMVYLVLTQEERDERAKLSAKLQGDLASQEAELKADNEYAKDRIKKTKAAMSAAAKAHNDGKEYQKVKCERIFDLDSKRTWLEHRGVRYEERGMYESELTDAQKTLFGKVPLNDVTEQFEREAKHLANAGRFVTRQKWNKWTESEKAEAQKWASKILGAQHDPKTKAPKKLPVHVEALPTEASKPKTSEELANDSTFMKAGSFLHTAGKELTRETWDSWTDKEKEMAIVWSGGGNKAEIGKHSTMPICVAALHDVVAKLPNDLAKASNKGKKPKLAVAADPAATTAPQSAAADEPEREDPRADLGYDKRGKS